MDLSVTHETRYGYTPAVEIAQHMAFLQPINTATQQVLQHTLEVTPEPAHRHNALDVFGNHRCFFSLQTPHEELGGEGAQPCADAAAGAARQQHHLGGHAGADALPQACGL